MTTATIRERLVNYIRIAEDKKIEAIYTLLEDQMGTPYNWADDAEFVAELDERVRRYEAGLDGALSIEESRLSLKELKKSHLESSKK